MKLINYLKAGAKTAPAFSIVLYYLFFVLDLYTTYQATPDFRYEGNWFVRILSLNWIEFIIFYSVIVIFVTILVVSEANPLGVENEMSVPYTTSSSLLTKALTWYNFPALRFISSLVKFPVLVITPKDVVESAMVGFAVRPQQWPWSVIPVPRSMISPDTLAVVANISETVLVSTFASLMISSFLQEKSIMNIIKRKEDSFMNDLYRC